MHESNKVGVQARVLWFLFAALALFGCSSDQPETTATQAAPVTFPLTITLATPNPVSPTAPVLLGSNSVRLGARAEVITGLTVSMGGGGLFADADALLNETWSRGTADLREQLCNIPRQDVGVLQPPQ